MSVRQEEDHVTVILSVSTQWGVSSVSVYQDISCHLMDVDVKVSHSNSVCINTVWSFQCECIPGYKLSPDGRRCKGKSFLYISFYSFLASGSVCHMLIIFPNSLDPYQA